MRVELHLDIIHERHAPTYERGSSWNDLLPYKSYGGEKKKRFNQSRFKLNYFVFSPVAHDFE